jgi:Bromodomain
MKSSSSSSAAASGAGGTGLSNLAQAKLDDLMLKCKQILGQLMLNKDADPFLEPVKWEEWGLRDYPKVIKHPMDLGTVNVS